MHKFNSALSLAQIATDLEIELQLVGNSQPDLLIIGLAGLDYAKSGEISFLANASYKKFLANTQASAVILTRKDADSCKVNKLITKDPRITLVKLLKLISKQNKYKKLYEIHPSAVIGDNCQIAADVRIGPNCTIGDNCVIGSGSVLHANVVLYSNSKLGKNVVLHAGAIIGSAGFGYERDPQGNWLHLEHLAGVTIGNNVEIGANTTIDRGLFEDTLIGDNVIIDNLVQIAHNVEIGSGTAMAGCVGIAGSAKIGKNCLIGGGANIAGHLKIGDNISITATSSVHKSLTKAGQYSSGFPVQDTKTWFKNITRFKFIDSMAKRLQKLENWVKTQT